jgi:hypothetical protein
VARARTLAQVYRHFGEVDAAETSPLYERVAVALSASEEALRAIEAAPARKRHPTVILAALHDLALAGRAPALAAAYAAGDGDAAAGAAIDTLLGMTDSVVAIAVRRPTRTNETGRCSVLYPAIAEAARRVGANAVGLIDLCCSAGLNLNVDRVGITYGNGQSLGDPLSPVQLSASIVGDRPIPTRAMPEVVARVGVDLDPVDVTDADDTRWLRACLSPDQPERVARLEAEMALAATAPPLLLQGDAVEMVPTPSPVCPRTPCLSSPRRGRCHSSRSSAACASCTASTKRRPAGRWRGCQRRESASRRRSRPLAIAAPLATASSVWRCWTGRLCAPRPLAAAGRRAACWRGWQTPRSAPLGCSGWVRCGWISSTMSPRRRGGQRAGLDARHRPSWPGCAGAWSPSPPNRASDGTIGRLERHEEATARRSHHHTPLRATITTGGLACWQARSRPCLRRATIDLDNGAGHRPGLVRGHKGGDIADVG